MTYESFEIIVQRLRFLRRPQVGAWTNHAAAYLVKHGAPRAETQETRIFDDCVNVDPPVCRTEFFGHGGWNQCTCYCDRTIHLPIIPGLQREIMAMKRLVKSVVNKFGVDIVKYRDTKITKQMDESYLEVLEDPAFRASVEEVRSITLLDTARLANLWQLCRMSNPDGSLIEIGSYKGGGAVHISNSCPERTVFVCDTFEGFGELPMDPKLDHLFARERFRDTSFDFVKSHWSQKKRDVRWVRGYFPESAADVEIANVSFAHIDLDIYESTVNTLKYLRPRLMDRSVVVFDDYLRGADGVVKAAREFSEAYPDWATFPLFPGQGLMIHRSWFA